jgi:hypothetical protein
MWGVLRARMYAQRRIVLYACAAALVAGLVEPKTLAGPLFLCSLLGIALALAQSPGIHPHLDWCELGAPLFGRQTARAKALVPCTAVALATMVYACGLALRGDRSFGITLATSLAAVLAASLVALCAAIRRGAPRALYIALAALVSVAAYAILTFARSIPAALGFCAIVAFVALRQYGEALGRYDPI